MNNQTFEEFYLKYRKISRGYAYGVLHDWSAADDVSQDVLYKMYTIKDGLNIDNEKMMFSLIKTASMNKALDYIRNQAPSMSLSVRKKLRLFWKNRIRSMRKRYFCVKRRKNLCIWC